MGLWHTNKSPNLGQKTRPYNKPTTTKKEKKKKEKKRTCKTVDIAVSADYRIKQKESKKKDTTSTLQGIWKKLWKMKVTNTSIVIGAFGTVTKGLLKGLEDLEVGGRVKTTETKA